MTVQFPEEGYRTLDEAGARSWCEDEIDNFIAHLVQTVPSEEMTGGRIRTEATNYIQSQQDTETFTAIKERCDGTNGLFLGLVITMMSEYLKVLVLNRFM